MGYRGGLQGSLTGRQNCKFISRIFGREEDIPERLGVIEDFTELGEAFDKPVNTYSSGMKSRLRFGMSLAFDFDIYISDEVTAAGDAQFKKKARSALRKLSNQAGLIMVSHSEKTLLDFCSVGIWLRDGQAYWYDDIQLALRDFKRQNNTNGHYDRQQRAS
jgi:capsular polysaccharide transport system ATP-binding protein